MNMVKNFFKVVSAADGKELAAVLITPEDGAEVKGIVQFVHGMVEHKERYYPLMEWLSERGYVCVIHDLRGHGATASGPEELGYMGKGGWKDMVDDVLETGNAVRAKFGSLPYTLVGHSMGSLIVRCYLKRYGDTIDRLVVSGCVSSNPAVGGGLLLADIIGRVRGWRHRSHLLQTICFSSYNRNFEQDGYKKAWVCSDREILEEYHNDPLCSFIFTADGFKNLFSLMKDCYDTEGWTVSRPDMPIRFISGAEDPCRISDKDFFKSVGFLRERGYRNVEGKLYPRMRHEVFMEKDKETVWNELLAELA